MELPAGDRGLDGQRWCVVTGGRGFMARHLVAALLRSGDWRVRITDLAPVATLEPDEEGLLGAALRVGLAEYVSADVCDLAQLTKGNLWEIQCFFCFFPNVRLVLVTLILASVLGMALGSSAAILNLISINEIQTN
jgi:hypothetical protein